MPKGRPRKTVQELKLSGEYEKRKRYQNYNGKTHSQIQEVKDPPEKYLDQTKKAWTSFMKVKVLQQVLSEEDLSLIEMMFDNLDLYYRMNILLNELVELNPDDLGQLKKLAEYSRIRRTSSDCFSSIAYRFGLTPVERTKLVIPEEKEELDPLDIVLNGY